MRRGCGAEARARTLAPTLRLPQLATDGVYITMLSRRCQAVLAGLRSSPRAPTRSQPGSGRSTSNRPESSTPRLGGQPESRICRVPHAACRPRWAPAWCSGRRRKPDLPKPLPAEVPFGLRPTPLPARKKTVREWRPCSSLQGHSGAIPARRRRRGLRGRRGVWCCRLAPSPAPACGLQLLPGSGRFRRPRRCGRESLRGVREAVLIGR